VEAISNFQKIPKPNSNLPSTDAQSLSTSLNAEIPTPAQPTTNKKSITIIKTRPSSTDRPKTASIETAPASATAQNLVQPALVASVVAAPLSSSVNTNTNTKPVKNEPTPTRATLLTVVEPNINQQKPVSPARTPATETELKPSENSLNTQAVIETKTVSPTAKVIVGEVNLTIPDANKATEVKFVNTDAITVVSPKKTGVPSAPSPKKKSARDSQQKEEKGDSGRSGPRGNSPNLPRMSSKSTYLPAVLRQPVSVLDTNVDMEEIEQSAVFELSSSFSSSDSDNEDSAAAAAALLLLAKLNEQTAKSTKKKKSKSLNSPKHRLNFLPIDSAATAKVISNYPRVLTEKIASLRMAPVNSVIQPKSHKSSDVKSGDKSVLVKKISIKKQQRLQQQQTQQQQPQQLNDDANKRQVEGDEHQKQPQQPLANVVGPVVPPPGYQKKPSSRVSKVDKELEEIELNRQNR
jgi:hypothetical protein